MSFYTDFPKYPTAIFDDTDYPNQTDDVSTVYAALVNALKEEMQACFDELGTVPKGAHASVKARLIAIEAKTHNTLASLQGGIADEYYHLSLQQHTEFLELIKVVLDLMEYATDEAAQLAYVSSDVGYTSDLIPDMTSNTAPSGVASASSQDGSFDPWKAMNDSNADELDCWISEYPSSLPAWLQYQFTSGKTIQRYTITSRKHPPLDTEHPMDWTLQGSNNGSDYDVLDTQTDEEFGVNEKKTYSFSNSTSYIYYRLNITAGKSNYIAIGEWELMEVVLQCYSSIIKIQGTYALKVLAAKTDSLNATLTKTVSPVKDLSGKILITLWARSDRTGENFKVEFHDSGGNTISHTVDIDTINTWEEQAIDISAVDDADKDAIDQIKYTIINADAAAEIYLDNNFAP